MNVHVCKSKTIKQYINTNKTINNELQGNTRIHVPFNRFAD